MNSQNILQIACSKLSSPNSKAAEGNIKWDLLLISFLWSDAADPNPVFLKSLWRRLSGFQKQQLNDMLLQMMMCFFRFVSKSLCSILANKLSFLMNHYFPEILFFLNGTFFWMGFLPYIASVLAPKLLRCDKKTKGNPSAKKVGSAKQTGKNKAFTYSPAKLTSRLATQQRSVKCLAMVVSPNVAQFFISFSNGRLRNFFYKLEYAYVHALLQMIPADRGGHYETWEMQLHWFKI